MTSIQLPQNSPKLCECGCGQPAPIAKHNHKDKGRVKGQPVRFIHGHNLDRGASEERFWAKVDKVTSPNGCWLWTGGTRPFGYGVHTTDEGHFIGAHRFSWILHNGPISDELCVCHNCPDGDNPACVNPAHLFLGTHTDNMRDKVSKGRSNVVAGEESNLSKLTEAQVREIKASPDIPLKALAAEHNVTTGTIWYIRNGKTWKHVD